MQKRYKVEMKGSLFEVHLRKGYYSDQQHDHILVSGNSEEEVWEFVKIWAQEGGLEERDHYYVEGIMWNDKKLYMPKGFSEEADFDWDWGAWGVEIKRAHVIYVNP